MAFLRNDLKNSINIKIEMKKTLSLLTISAFTFCTATAQKFTLKGTLDVKDPVEKVYFGYETPESRFLDSADLVNKNFNFSGEIPEPTLANILVKYAQKTGEPRARTESYSVFLEPSVISLKAKDSLKLAKVEGSKAHTVYEAYSKLLVPFNAKVAVLNDRFRAASEAKDEEEISKIRAEYSTAMDEKNENILGAYVKKNPASPIALFVLGQYAGYDIDVAKVEPIFESLSAENKKSVSGLAFKKRLESARKTMVGVMAMNFTQNDTLGNPVSLTDFRGQYVLIDFWASWCGPCREENPNVVKAFHDYKDKGFTVLGISLDQPGKKDEWLKAIRKDQLTWTQLSDLKFWNNEVAQLYGVGAIPENLLVDPSGKIIAKNIRGEELHSTLAKFIK